MIICGNTTVPTDFLPLRIGCPILFLALAIIGTLGVSGVIPSSQTHMFSWISIGMGSATLLAHYFLKLNQSTPHLILSIVKITLLVTMGILGLTQICSIKSVSIGFLAFPLISALQWSQTRFCIEKEAVWEQFKPPSKVQKRQ